MSGWIKLHRKLTDWEWFNDSNMVHLFIYLLIAANHKPKKWKGIDINRGQLITGRDQLSKKTGISTQTIRTCLNRLKSTNEITIKPTNRYSLITLCNYDEYQVEDSVSNQQTNHQTNQQLTSNQPATNQQLTTNKNDKKKEEEKNVNIPFGTFWNLYDKKTGDKSKLQKKWNGLKDSEREEIIKTLPTYVQSTPDKKFRKNPQTYLNNRSWEDEIIESNLYPGYKDTSNWDVKKNDQSDFSDYE